MAVRFTAVVLGGLLSTIVPTQAAEQPQKAPEQFRVKFETTAGDFVMEVHRKWSPQGVDQFHRLIQEEFYKEARFFRVVPGFVVQWGIAGDPKINRKWDNATIQDEPVVASNMRGFVTYAKSSAPNSRTTQLFINLKDNQRLDSMGFSPFARVTEGMDVVEKITAQYGERPKQPLIERQGNAYLKSQFPRLDYIKSAVIIPVDE